MINIGYVFRGLWGHHFNMCDSTKKVRDECAVQRSVEQVGANARMRVDLVKVVRVEL
jgi:hypothetical protein